MTLKTSTFSADKRQVVIIGAGAAGFFSAINLARRDPEVQIRILEKTGKLLSKVKISGGGRCNVTHHCFNNRELVQYYPRGHKELLQVFSQFAVQDTIQWFRREGIELHTEADGRMFPVTNNSQTIIDCFLNLAAELSIHIHTHCDVTGIQKTETGLRLITSKGNYEAETIICATGGNHKPEFYRLFESLGHSIESPVPSLFTINLPNNSIRKVLQGLSVQQAEVKVKGTKLHYEGPVLITHWGLSGPAVLKLSAFAAKEFHQRQYRAEIIVNWAHPLSGTEIESGLKALQKQKPKASPYSHPQFAIPKRLWEYLCAQAGIPEDKPWAEISNKLIMALVMQIHQSTFAMEGKTTFKEEFVTCGGIQLKEVNFKTMESKLVPRLFFCGEVLNIDGITGGFNFQNAWSTAWICAQHA